MLYLYDNAIATDLTRSFNPENVGNTTVKVFKPDDIVDIEAALMDDRIKLPFVSLQRLPEKIDTSRWNFTRAHKGIVKVIDPETNNLYYEKLIPIDLRYTLTMYTANTVDADELLREMMFKYLSMFFLEIQLPYEDKSFSRFGVELDTDANIESDITSADYLKQGKLYQRKLFLKCQGCVLLNYTPRKLVRPDTEIIVE